jgi:AAA15 family ATPase/GTPase
MLRAIIRAGHRHNRSVSLCGEMASDPMSADGKLLVMITGANRGGKSTFLRAIGLAVETCTGGFSAPSPCGAMTVARQA